MTKEGKKEEGKKCCGGLACIIVEGSYTNILSFPVKKKNKIKYIHDNLVSFLTVERRTMGSSQKLTLTRGKLRSDKKLSVKISIYSLLCLFTTAKTPRNQS